MLKELELGVEILRSNKTQGMQENAIVKDTNSTEQSPSWEADSHSATQEIS
jgi:hypothetical protein